MSMFGEVVYKDHRWEVSCYKDGSVCATNHKERITMVGRYGTNELDFLPAYLMKRVERHFNPLPEAEVFKDGQKIGGHNNPKMAIKLAKDTLDTLITGYVSVIYKGDTIFEKEVNRQ